MPISIFYFEIMVFKMLTEAILIQPPPPYKAYQKCLSNLWTPSKKIFKPMQFLRRAAFYKCLLLSLLFPISMKLQILNYCSLWFDLFLSLLVFTSLHWFKLVQFSLVFQVWSSSVLFSFFTAHFMWETWFWMPCSIQFEICRIFSTRHCA